MSDSILDHEAKLCGQKVEKISVPMMHGVTAGSLSFKCSAWETAQRREEVPTGELIDK